MPKTKYRPLENPKGEGRVYKGDEQLAVVEYDLIVKQEVYVGDDGREIEGHKDMHGEIYVNDGRKNLLDMEMLTLQLDDGRYIDFLIGRQFDKDKGDYHIMPLADFRDSLLKD